MIDPSVGHQEFTTALERLRHLALAALDRASPNERTALAATILKQLREISASLEPPPPPPKPLSIAERVMLGATVGPGDENEARAQPSSWSKSCD